MKEAFTRRGFTKAALLGSAGLWMPSLVAGQDSPSIDSRLVASSSGSGHLFELRLTNQEERGLEVLAAALQLRGTIRSGETSVRVAFTSQARSFGRRSRAGFRLGRRILLPPGEETLYDTYQAQWAPAALRQRAALVVRTALEADVSGDQADGEGSESAGLVDAGSARDHAALTSLGQLRLRTTVVLPR